MKTAGKAEHLESQKQTKRVILKRETKKKHTIKRNGRFPVQELNEMEASKLSDIEFKRMVIRMPKELTDNYKELSGNYK